MKQKHGLKSVAAGKANLAIKTGQQRNNENDKSKKQNAMTTTRVEDVLECLSDDIWFIAAS